MNDLDKVKTAESGLRAPVVVRNEVFGSGEGAVALSTLMARYAERPRLPLIIAPPYFQEIVTAGVNNGTWLYYDSALQTAYDTLEPVGDIVFDADHLLMLPEEVERRGIPVWSPEPKPEPTKKEDDDDDDVRDRPTDYGAEVRLEKSGEPRRALVDLTAAAQDQGWKAIRLLEIKWTGEHGDAAHSMGHLRTLMGQMAGNDASVECSLVCEFGQDGVLETRYSGDYARYQAVAGTLETQASQADSAFVNTDTEAGVCQWPGAQCTRAVRPARRLRSRIPWTHGYSR